MSPYVTWHLAWIQACDHTDVNLRISKLRNLHAPWSHSCLMPPDLATSHLKIPADQKDSAVM